MRSSDPLEQEASIISQYLVGRNTAAANRTYARVLGDSPLSARQARQWRLMLRYHWTIGCFDTALALTDPHSEIRRRLYLMFAILETQPGLYSQFAATHQNRFYFFKVFAIGCRSMTRLFCGLILLRVVR